MANFIVTEAGVPCDYLTVYVIVDFARWEKIRSTPAKAN